MLTAETPPRMIGDKAFDSHELDEQPAEQGIEPIAPHRSNCKPENYTRDGRPLRRHMRRRTVERTIAWIPHFRRLCIRRERLTTLFQGFRHPGCTMLLLKEGLAVRRKRRCSSPPQKAM